MHLQATLAHTRAMHRERRTLPFSLAGESLTRRMVKNVLYFHILL